MKWERDEEEEEEMRQKEAEPDMEKRCRHSNGRQPRVPPVYRYYLIIDLLVDR